MRHKYNQMIYATRCLKNVTIKAFCLIKSVLMLPFVIIIIAMLLNIDQFLILGRLGFAAELSFRSGLYGWIIRYPGRGTTGTWPVQSMDNYRTSPRISYQFTTGNCCCMLFYIENRNKWGNLRVIGICLLRLHSVLTLNLFN